MSVHLIFRPLLIPGMLVRNEENTMHEIMIDSESPERVQCVSIWHETVHLLLVASGQSEPHDEEMIEGMAERLAAACPEIVQLVKKYQPEGRTQ